MRTNEIMLQIPDKIVDDWQKIVNILSRIISVPAALVMRLDGRYIEVFVSSESKGNPYRSGHKATFEDSGLYCERVINTKDKLLVPDALEDEVWRNNPDIEFGLVSYLGFPILLPNQATFGTICVLDNKRNAYSEDIETLMITFRNLIESNLETVFMNQILGDENKRLSEYLGEIQAFRGIVTICSYCKSIKDAQNEWHPIEKYLFSHPGADFSHGICPECMKKIHPHLGK